jgi:hypothetical protein
MNARKIFGDIEGEILIEARRVLKNSRLRKKDILEWAFGDVQPLAGEVAVGLAAIGCNICTLKAKDKRIRPRAS